MAPIRRRNKAQHRLRLNDQCDIHRKFPGALQKLFGAIQWINHPAHWPVTPTNELLQRRLLRQDRDFRCQRLQCLANQSMRSVISLGYGAGV